ncbi:ABC transporter ATP-binding protein [Candidatus Magnetaquicoccus inordinatus]|uniref:ABC transporter ATP-binding protein n=1 Tax=Candidatus Magnetaquicoccus inordinatus TaxID=2496818 RepID=UPI00102CD29E|nr:ABC transporter ATP-binding protein [Candidatus Magnetaquicoccus inordinatus]
MAHNTLINLAQVSCLDDDHNAEQQPLFDSLNWSIHAGERWAIVGKESSGKTLLLRLMAGLIPTDQGEIRWQGQSVPGNLLTGDLGVIFSDAGQRFLTATVWEEVALTPAQAGLRGESLQSRVAEALQQAGLASSLGQRELSTLSSAEAYRVSVAAVLAMQPTLLLLDEPGAVLDEVGEAELAQRLRSFSSVTFTSRLSRAKQFADRLAWLEKGKLYLEE